MLRPQETDTLEALRKLSGIVKFGEHEPETLRSLASIADKLSAWLNDDRASQANTLARLAEALGE